MNYYDVPALSYSKIKNFSIHPKYFKAQEEKQIKSTRAMNNGSLFDLMITEPENVQDKIFTTIAGPSETTQLGTFFKHLRDTLYANNYVDLGILEELYQKTGFKQKTFEKVVEEIKPYQDYLNNELEAINSGKIVISTEDYQKTETTANFFKNSLLYREYLDNRPNRYQIQIFGKIYNTDFKCKPDIINNEVFDLKLTKPSEFYNSFEKFRYFYQGGIYITMLNNEGYDFNCFNFITVDPENIQPPMIYTMSLDECKKVIGKNEDVFTYNNKQYKSVFKIINEIDWHNSNNKWDYEVDVYLNNLKKGIWIR